MRRVDEGEVNALTRGRSRDGLERGRSRRKAVLIREKSADAVVPEMKGPGRAEWWWLLPRKQAWSCAQSRIPQTRGAYPERIEWNSKVSGKRSACPAQQTTAPATGRQL